MAMEHVCVPGSILCTLCEIGAVIIYTQCTDEETEAQGGYGTSQRTQHMDGELGSAELLDSRTALLGSAVWSGLENLG